MRTRSKRDTKKIKRENRKEDDANDKKKIQISLSRRGELSFSTTPSNAIPLISFE